MVVAPTLRGEPFAGNGFSGILPQRFAVFGFGARADFPRSARRASGQATSIASF